jgi:type I restriction enzyme S subunit
MSSEWVETTWGQISTLEYGKGLRDYKSSDKRFPVYGTNGLIGTYDNYLCPQKGVIIGRKGAYRGVHFSPTPFYVIDTAYWLNHSDQVDAKWAYYELLCHDINALDSGSAIPSTSRDSFYGLPVALPPLHEQRSIVKILGTLDDKIELNRKTNETLEGIAKALFRSWFVDFDPVRAKAEGRPTGLPEEIIELFPDSFEDSELGEIPRGWEIQSIGEISINHDSKRVPVSGSDRAKRKGSFPYYGATGIVDWIDDFLLDGTYLLIGEDGSVERDDGTAFSQYVNGKIWVNNHAHVLTGLNSITTEQLYLYFQFIQVAPYVTGAVQLKISQGRLNSIPVAVAPIALNEYFSGIIQNLLERRISIERENSSLALIRDTLLPKLISGELRVPDAEKMLEEVGI